MSKGIDPLKVVERQNAIIRIQSGVIDELFLLLMQHISADEADSLPCIARINQAAEIRAEIGVG
ncbi:hypothetical protein D7Y41_18820 [Anaerotruncus sp. 1XD22-93]|nr:hypothetical protein [Lachnospiraceae bacterium]NBI71695.1 hypothetical protein [Clostridiaceae bacterium]NBI75477.1 hypothetical protein [Lachnospiraceae bacterium]RKJ87078.1 hypothetical protein D7Y41_18820 [Anaerotruncus sp. 1XD22-93]